ncbi:MAG: serine/threonine protein phosphatase PrpC [Myxococcota bacterium]|jgi:serine/threonine protein phosphatase PrpC
MPFRVSCAAWTHPGVRHVNEDAFRIGAGVVAVVDSMGAMASAADLCQRAVEALVATPDAAVGFQDAARVFEADGTGAGAAAAHLTWTDTHWRFAHLGDVRILLVRSGRWRRLTVDHSLAERHPEVTMPGAEHILMLCIGHRGSEPEIGEIDALAGDMIVLCTDGLWEILALDGPLPRAPASVVAELAESAVLAGISDNATVVVVERIA